MSHRYIIWRTLAVSAALGSKKAPAPESAPSESDAPAQPVTAKAA